MNLEMEDGRRLFRQMAEKADVILETFRPGYLASLGLGYEDLAKSNPGLIMCSLTPFGQTGPWQNFQTSDCCIWRRADRWLGVAMMTTWRRCTAHRSRRRAGLAHRKSLRLHRHYRGAG